MIFWIVAIGCALMIAGVMALALLKGRTGDEPPAAYDLRVYRDQLTEVDKDLARGVISAEDGERTKLEISRRILAADTQLKAGGDTGGQPAKVGKVVAALIVAFVVGGTAALYLQIGAPGVTDMPLQSRIEAAKVKHANRPSQAAYEAKLPVQPTVTPDGEFGELITKLRKTVADRPDDLEGSTLLARNEANLNNVKAAYQAQENVLRLKGQDATLDDHLFYAELLIASAQGYVSPEAEASLQAARGLDPNQPLVRYYLGLMLIQNDRPDLAFRTWDKLLRESPPTALWVPPIKSRIKELAWLTGVEYELPAQHMAEAPALSGPSAEDMEAAADMSTEDRQAMIEGMVDQLGERLATEGGTPQEWARMLGALGVLGRSGQAAAIWEEAQMRFADKPEALEIVRQGARQAGVAE